MDFRGVAASLFYPVTEWLNYALLGFLVGLVWAFLGPLGALVVLVVGTFTVRPMDKLRWRIAKTLGLTVSAPTPVQMVFSQTIGVVVLIGVAGLWGIRVAPLEVLGITVMMLVLSTALAFWAQRLARRNP